MPSPNTFEIKPIAAFIDRYISTTTKSADPFARNSRLANYTNDINPTTGAKHHLDAEDFLLLLKSKQVRIDVGLFDPPYSPRQISECYKSIGMNVTANDTQNARLYKRVRDAMDCLIKPRGIALSFGWNSAGFGKTRGYQIVEILLVAHGGAHNDTICVAEMKVGK